MPNRTSHRSNGKGTSRTRPTNPTVPVLNKILQTLEQQQTSQVPERPDVAIRSKPKSERIYSFTQAYVGPNITTSSTIETDGAFTFSLSQLPNATSFAALFDRYRIRQARVTFNPNAVEGTLTSGVTAGPIYTVLDYDDPTPITIANLVNYDNLKTAPAGAFFERTLTPRVALAAYSGVFTSFAQGNPNQWIDVASPSVQYYGIKFGLPIGLAASGTVVWNTIITLDLEFSHPR